MGVRCGLVGVGVSWELVDVGGKRTSKFLSLVGSQSGVSAVSDVVFVVTSK